MNEQEINRYWKRIIDTMSEGLLLIGPDGTILTVNRAFEELTGYRAIDIIGRPCTTLDCDACDQTLHAGEGHWCVLFRDGTDIDCRCTIVAKDGSCLPLLKKATLLKSEDGKLLGAVETLTDISQLVQLDQEVHRLSRQLEYPGGFFGLIGESVSMQKVFELVTKAATSRAPVIIFGESGTGKELVAQAIHLSGARRDKPYVQMNCAAFNESLIESELFGHVRGAFTGAYAHRKGRFEEAHGGDIFLDEIGDVPLSLQTKLLRVLESNTIERVGDSRTVPVDVRIITATNKDLYQLIARKEFREDLFFRISVIPIILPPLRERTGDIPLLANYFLDRLRQKTGKPITGLSREVMDAFTRYTWPGNVREFKSALEYAFTIADRGTVQLDQIPPRLTSGGSPNACFASEMHPTEEDPEKTALLDALRQTNGNQTKAALLLGISRVTVWNRIRKHRIQLKKNL
jgi:two-component system, NtrC family, response regulator HydG